MFFDNQKLFFKVSDKVGDISFTEALAGAAGTVALGAAGVSLWTPTTPAETLNDEVICDARYAALSDALYQKFIAAMEGKLLPAHAVLFQGKDPKKIKSALQYFDYVLVPDRHIKNLPNDIRKRVLSYKVTKN